MVLYHLLFYYMSKLINKNKLNSFAIALWTKIRQHFVSKTNPNLVTGETVLTNGYVSGPSKVTQKYNGENTNGTPDKLATPTSYFGIPRITVSARTQVDEIVVVLADDAGDIDSTIEGGATIGVINAATNRLIEYVQQGVECRIAANTIPNQISGQKVVKIPINKSWDEDVYFLIAVKGAWQGWSGNQYPSIGGNTLPALNQQMSGMSAWNYIGKFAIYTNKYPLNDISVKAIYADSEVRFLKDDYVSTTKSNLVQGKTTLVDGYILYNTATVVNNTNATSVINGDNWCGTPALSANAGTYISYLCVGVDDNLSIGTEISNIKIATVDKSNNRVLEHITTNGKAIVVKNTYEHISSSKVILYPIQQSFASNIYFILGFRGMKWGSRSNSNWLTVVPRGSFPNVNTNLVLNNTNWIPQAAIFAEETNIKTMLDSIQTIEQNKAGLSTNNEFTNRNSFHGVTDFNDVVNVKYVHTIEEALLDGNGQKASEWLSYFDREVYIPNGAYVSTLNIRVINSLSNGQNVNNLYIYEVVRGNNIDNDRIVNVQNNVSASVSTIEGYGKAITINLNRKFTSDTYFIIGHKRAEGGYLLIGSDSLGNIRRVVSGKPFILNQHHSIRNESTSTNDKLIHRYIVEEINSLQENILDVKEDIFDLKTSTVKITDVGVEGNKIPRLDNNGKLITSTIPNLAITEVFTVTSENALMSQRVDTGDIVMLRQSNNNPIPYMCINPSANTKNDKFIALNLSSGSVTSVNGVTPDNQGGVTLNIANIPQLQDRLNSFIPNSQIGTGSGQIATLNNDGKFTTSVIPNLPISHITNLQNTINSKINETDVVTSSTPNKIVRLDNNGKMNPNMMPTNLTEPLNYQDVTPTITKDYVYGRFGSDTANYQREPNSDFFYMNNYRFNNNININHILVPIANAQPGDYANIAFCIVNGNNRQIIYNPYNGLTKAYPVTNIRAFGGYCARVNIGDRSYNHPIVIGLRVMSNTYNGRQQGAMYAMVNGVRSYRSSSMPVSGNIPSDNSDYSIPYLIVDRQTSQIVTRYDISNNSITTQPSPRNIIGELKSFAYDAGAETEIDGQIWLRCEGQNLDQEEYSELAVKLSTGESRTSLFSLFSRSNDNTCTLPENNSIGYLYICAKNKE